MRAAIYCNGVRIYEATLGVKGARGVVRLKVDGKAAGFAKWDQQHGLYDLPASIPHEVVPKLEEDLRRG